MNQVTPSLFARAPDAKRMSAMPVTDIQDAIKQIGLAKTKANNLHRMATMLVERYDGEVPSTFEELEELPGVGHKTASVIMAQAFGYPSFPVDTHIHRLAQRWGLTDGKNVQTTEADLKSVFPEELWNDLHLQIIYFGREHCPAQRHDPTNCPICSWAAVPPYDQAGSSPLKPGQSHSRRPDQMTPAMAQDKPKRANKAAGTAKQANELKSLSKSAVRKTAGLSRRDHMQRSDK